MRRLRKTERREQILAELRLAPHVRISALAERFGVSAETVRRDVDALSDEGLVNRAYGGASAAPMGVQPPFGERDRARIEERARIGRLAASLVKPGEVLMIDAGSTTTQLARALTVNGKGLTVLTNSLSVAQTLGQNGSADIMLCPGDYMPNESAVYGSETEAFISRFHANRAFIGAGAIAPEGIMDVNRAGSGIKRAMLRQAEKVYALIDHSKFNQMLLSLVVDLGAIDVLICDQEPTGALAKALREAKVEVRIAGENSPHPVQPAIGER
jgi:DeoR/GlpR family transcriptional regulator of sugar metabolism